MDEILVQLKNVVNLHREDFDSKFGSACLGKYFNLIEDHSQIRLLLRADALTEVGHS